MTNLELTFTNAFGEILSLKNSDKDILFNHSDVHENDYEWDNIKKSDVVFNEHEKIVISRFSRLVNEII
jgi:hypothetical protein